jgi:IclR family transcriptional regulator, acetate operon repressor
VLLAHQLVTRADVAEWAGSGLVRRTPHTRCTVDDLHRELERTRTLAYGIDDQEDELRINRVALPMSAMSPHTPSGAVSVSALTYRAPSRTLVDAVAEIRELLGSLGGVS